jgi:hypothetical protein
MAIQLIAREDVEQLRLRFAEHRQTHAARTRLPRELWAAAAKLARRDGITATARALAVDLSSMKRWTERLEPRDKSRKSGKAAAPPTFVELLAAETAPVTSCQVEAESPRGAKLRLEFKSITAEQLAELVRAFARS